jgi:hypothetical protein
MNFGSMFGTLAALFANATTPENGTTLESMTVLPAISPTPVPIPLPMSPRTPQMSKFPTPLPSQKNDTEEIAPDGWKKILINEYNTILLIQALSNPLSYSEDIMQHICMWQVRSIEKQVVSGTNYRFRLKGCRIPNNMVLGSCGERYCTKLDYEVVVYSQEWTRSFKIASIDVIV